jgi:4-amino-4-deoxy-L-arabinose transferase-like glycosyltransferase
MKHKIFIILIFGFLLRIIGINFGLPLLTHADEPIVVNHALAYGGGDFNPHFFKIPPLVSYFLFFIYGIYFLVGKIFGIFADSYDYLEQFLLNPSWWYIIGRLFVGVFPGALSIYSLYLLAKRTFDKNIASMSALFFSFSFIHILHSHYIYLDIPLVLAVIWTAILSLRLYKAPTTKNYIIAGFLVGICSAVKYNGLLASVFVIFAHFLGKEKRNFFKPLLSVFFFILSFFIFNPFAFLDFSFFKRELFLQAKAETFVGWGYHLKNSLVEGVGIFMLLFASLGIILSLYKEKKKSLILFSFPLIFFIGLGIFSQYHERYVLPVVPFLCIYAAYFLCKISLKNACFNTFLKGILILLVILPNLVKSLWLDYISLRKDTRLLTKEWIEKNIPQNSKIALDHSFFCPRLWPTKEQLKDKLKIAKTKGQKIKLKILINSKKYPCKNYQLFYLWDIKREPPQFLFSLPLIEYNLERLKEEGILYVVTHKDICKKEKDFFIRLKKEAKLLKKITPYFDEKKKCSQEKIIQTGLPFFSKELFSRKRPGYPIFIYKLTF